MARTLVRKHKRKIKSGKVINVPKHWRKFKKRMQQAEQELNYVREGKTQQDMEIGGQFQSLVTEPEPTDIPSEPERSGSTDTDNQPEPKESGEIHEHTTEPERPIHTDNEGE